MAKSIRSKRKRMFRNIKRQRYAVKELIRLKKMLGVPVTEPEAAVPPTNVIEYNLKSQPEVKEEPIEPEGVLGYSFTQKGTLRVELSDSEGEMNAESQKKRKSTMGETEMEHSEKKVYNPVTMKDKFGKYPAWYTQKLIKRHVKQEKLRKKITEKQKKLKDIADRKNKQRKKEQSRPRKRRTTEQSSIVEQSTDEKESMKMEENSSEQQSIIVEQSNDVIQIEN